MKSIQIFDAKILGTKIKVKLHPCYSNYKVILDTKSKMELKSRNTRYKAAYIVTTLKTNGTVHTKKYVCLNNWYKNMFV